MKKKIIVIINLVLLGGAGLFADTISLEDVRTLALTNSRSLAKYSMSIRSSLLDEKTQLYAVLPSVSAGYSASMSYLDKNWGFVNPVDTLSAGMDFSVTQKIFEGGKNTIQRAISKISTESVRNEAMAEYFNVMDSADNAFYAVLEAAATLEAEESSLQTVLASLTIAEVRQANGMINQGDFLKAMADREARENSRNQARRNLSLNMTKLRALTGITGTIEPEQINFGAYENLIQFLADITDDEADAMYDRFWKVLAESNPSLTRAALNSRRAEYNFSLTKRDYLPVISATIFSTGVSYSAAGKFGSSSGGGITIRGSIPVDFWIMNNRIEKSRIARDSSALDFISAEINLETDLQSALLNLLAYSGSVLTSRRSLEYTEKHFEYVGERYRLSQSSISDLNDATTLLINSRNSHIKACYGFLQSLSRLRSLGAVDDENKLINLLMNNQ